MKILAMEKEISNYSDTDFKPHLKAEATRVWELYQSGVFREIYFDKNKHNAIIIMECNDLQEAEEYLGTLPLVKEELIYFEMIALEAYSGFARLFGN
ncbi:MAG TPA: superoxide dismutase [Firmicutes bacterium]|nr:superoxide dismutase [Bacillota bacterium]